MSITRCLSKCPDHVIRNRATSGRCEMREVDMNFQERERAQMIEERDRLFKVSGLGLFAGKPREFVLSEPTKAMFAQLAGRSRMARAPSLST